MKAIAPLMRLWPRLQCKIYTILISGQFKKMGRDCWISPPFEFGGLGEVVVAEDVGIARNCLIVTTGERSSDDIPKIEIGAHSRIGRGNVIAAGKSVVIGDYVLTAPQVYICDHTHVYEDTTRPIMKQDDRTVPVFIGNGSWLGANVVVLPGVTIGEHCVIGANAVVTTSIPSFSVAVGSPARVVRQYVKSTKRWEKTT